MIKFPYPTQNPTPPAEPKPSPIAQDPPPAPEVSPVPEKVHVVEELPVPEVEDVTPIPLAEDSSSTPAAPSDTPDVPGNIPARDTKRTELTFPDITAAPSPELDSVIEPPKPSQHVLETAPAAVPAAHSSNGYVEHLYKTAVVYAERILYNDQNITPSDIQQFRRLTEKLIELVKQDNEQLFRLLFHYVPTGVDPLFMNMANVCILSLELGVGLGYTQSQLMDLGLAAFLHDAGMKEYMDLVNKSGDLKPRERAEMREHTLAAPVILRHVEESLTQPVMQAISDEHERVDGSGYPRGVGSGRVHEYARIIGLTDVFEALTHDRSYRKRMSPLDAVRTIMQNKKLFDGKIVKMFLTRIGFYPKGSFVMLNTEEVGQVVRQNPYTPLSPVVRVIYDSEGQRIDNGKEIDLSEGTRIFVSKSFDQIQ